MPSFRKIFWHHLSVQWITSALMVMMFRLGSRNLTVLVVRSERTDVPELGMFMCTRKTLSTFLSHFRSADSARKLVSYSIAFSSFNDISINNLPLSFLTWTCYVLTVMKSILSLCLSHMTMKQFDTCARRCQTSFTEARHEASWSGSSS